MKTSKHTKGPWEAFIWDKNKPHEIAIGATQADGGADHVCIAEFKGGMADARLIAAAPDLLESLKQLTLLLDGTPYQASVDIAKRVIAKAEGRDEK